MRLADGTFREDDAVDASLVACWEQLATAEPGNVKDMAALERVWRETSPAAEEWPTLAPRAARPPKPARATAAHPRAFRGTIQQPPTAPTELVDLRPSMSRWSQVTRALGISEMAEPGLYWPTGATLDELPARVREAAHSLLPCSLEALQRLGRALGRVDAPRHFLFCGDVDSLTGWLEAMQVLGEAERAQVFDALRLGLPKATPDLPSVLARLAALGTRSGAAMLIDRMRRGAAGAYVVGGLELRNERGEPARHWTFDAAGAHDVSPLVRETLARLGNEAREWSASSLHDVLGRLPDASPFVRCVLDSDADAHELKAWVGVRSCLRYECEPVWAAGHAMITSAVAERTKVAPEHRHRFPDHIAEGLWRLESARPKDIAAILATATETAPYRREVMTLVADLHLEDFALPRTPAFLQAADDALHRRSHVPLVAGGLVALLSALPEWSGKQLASDPRRLLKLARAIGALHPTRTRTALCQAQADALWPLPDSISELREVFEPLRALYPAIVPRTLRAFFEGRPLTEAQQQRRLLRVRARWGELRMALCRHHVDLERQRGITASARRLEESERHALDLLSRAGPHRRGLRRVLRALLEGDEDPVVTHPRSRQWFDAHPAIDAEKWLRGIERRHGDVLLAVEQDVLEVLRMGDYARSCLGMGGIFESDPAGIPLDVNKRVVYARDANGRVLARQLLAITEDDRLVCHAVYGRAELDDAFADYDRDLAALLQIPIADSDYTVEFILAQQLWDDGSWVRE